MPKYRRRFGRKRFRRRAKRRYKPRMRRTLTPSTGLLTCYQKYSEIEPIPSSGAAGSFTSGSMTFSLANLIGNVGNFTRLFKYWKLLGVKVTFVPRYIGETGAPAGEPVPNALINGNMLTAITLDSNQLPTTTPNWANVDTAEQSSNLKKRYLSPQTGGRTAHVVRFRPKLNTWVRASATGAANVATLDQTRPWISTGSPNTEYYGLKWAYECNNAHPGFILEVRTSLLLTFKGVI